MDRQAIRAIADTNDYDVRAVPRIGVLLAGRLDVFSQRVTAVPVRCRRGGIAKHAVRLLSARGEFLVDKALRVLKRDAFVAQGLHRLDGRLPKT